MPLRQWCTLIVMRIVGPADSRRRRWLLVIVVTGLAVYMLLALILVSRDYGVPLDALLEPMPPAG